MENQKKDREITKTEIRNAAMEIIGKEGFEGITARKVGAANTPIAAIIMAVELFGPQIAPYAAMSCVISFF